MLRFRVKIAFVAVLGLVGCSAPFAPGEGPMRVEILAGRTPSTIWLDGTPEQHANVIVAFLSGSGDLMRPDPTWTSRVWTVIGVDASGNAWANREEGFAPLGEPTPTGGDTGYRVRARTIEGPGGVSVEVEARCDRDRQTVLRAAATIPLATTGMHDVVLPLDRVAP